MVNFWFFSFLGENGGCPGLLFFIVNRGIHGDPGEAEGLGMSTQIQHKLNFTATLQSRQAADA